MAYEQLITLIYQLVSKTQSGDLRWERTADGSVFQASFPSYAVQIQKYFTSKRETVYRLGLLDDQGQEIEAVTARTLQEEMSDSWERFAELFNLARRNALGADKAVAEILKHLENPTSDQDDG